MKLNVWEQPKVTGCHSCRGGKTKLRDTISDGEPDRALTETGPKGQRRCQGHGSFNGGTQRISGPKSLTVNLGKSLHLSETRSSQQPSA